MISYEKNIESMYREPVYATGGGTRLGISSGRMNLSRQVIRRWCLR